MFLYQSCFSLNEADLWESPSQISVSCNPPLSISHHPCNWLSSWNARTLHPKPKLHHRQLRAPHWKPKAKNTPTNKQNLEKNPGCLFYKERMLNVKRDAWPHTAHHPFNPASAPGPLLALQNQSVDVFPRKAKVQATTLTEKRKERRIRKAHESGKKPDLHHA